MGLWDKIRAFFTSDENSANSVKPANPAHPVSSDNSSNSVKDFIVGTAEEVKEQGSQLWKEVKEKVHDLDESTKEYREKLADKAKETLEKIDEFVDRTVEKAKALEAEEKLKDADKDGIADKPIDFGKPLSEKSEDFFSKAEQWLEQNESGEKIHKHHPDDSDESKKNKEIHPIELPKDQ